MRSLDDTSTTVTPKTLETKIQHWLCEDEQVEAKDEGVVSLLERGESKCWKLGNERLLEQDCLSVEFQENKNDPE